MLPAWAGRRGSGRRPGSVLVAVATGLLFLLGVGLFAVSLDAQYRYVFHAKHQSAASWVEALALDVGMAIFSLLALGLARAGKPARAERVLIMACAAASGVMNFAAANDASPKSVLAYVMPPVFLAVVADRVVSVARRHVLGEDERSPWLAAAAAGLVRGAAGAGPAEHRRRAAPLAAAQDPAARSPGACRGAGAAADGDRRQARPGRPAGRVEDRAVPGPGRAAARAAGRLPARAGFPHLHRAGTRGRPGHRRGPDRAAAMPSWPRGTGGRAT